MSEEYSLFLSSLQRSLTSSEREEAEGGGGGECVSNHCKRHSIFTTVHANRVVVSDLCNVEMGLDYVIANKLNLVFQFVSKITNQNSATLVEQCI